MRAYSTRHTHRCKGRSSAVTKNPRLESLPEPAALPLSPAERDARIAELRVRLAGTALEFEARRRAAEAQP